MNEHDLFHRFIFEEHEIRGELVRLEQSFIDAFAQSDYPEAVQTLLGEALAASVLLSGTLKFDGILSLQARGNGPVTLLMAECTHYRKVRAIAQYQNIPETVSSIQEQLGQGQLVITIDPEKGQRYQGIIPMEKPDLSSCLEDYFTQSEQLETTILLFCDETGAAGMLLQKLPGYREDDETWNRLETLARSITFEELRSLPAEQILHRLFHEEDVRLFPGEAVSFECSCSKARCTAAIEALGSDDAYTLVAEQGTITIDCQFCAETYTFKKEELDTIFHTPPLH
ncbi:heat shock protein 33, redox regulated chaperone [Oleiphilus messinensis]|uniref:33 kDa chaperonin n=1 Tax=Oleiphilus messinensis TaxID=141451 RepID=A0A1Y0I2F5_9GAMM|nr:Hsp33 family molecular chaperone HslO [Oleiphilus messinensis]ARU54440.1 heat shock protein 33, redox regulated chaperone [Oleiphilus messinensis]